MSANNADSSTRVPFWIVLAGVGAGAFWALVGVAVGALVSRRRRDRPALAGATPLPWRRRPFRSGVLKRR
ncbi:hypothetical protein ACX80W_12145 [Arthrobacter sp. TMN-37]